MNSVPPALSNVGLICYLNSGMQAVSACSRFVNDISELDTKYDLEKLRFFNSLLMTMNFGEHSINISRNDIFNEWNKRGQQDSFDLLSYVINKVYDEIRQHLESSGDIEKRNLKQWIDVKLPLRMKMKYHFNCECGYEESSPIQSEIAIHLSFPPEANNNYRFWQTKEILCIDDMLAKHFEREEINGFQCGSKNCESKRGWRTLNLYSIPDSICTHLQRLHWNGREMKKINVQVSFSNKLTIRETFFKKEAIDSIYTRNSRKYQNGNKIDNQSNEGIICDVDYYLKSVIVHYGEESFGHYICYKKIKGSWHYTSDTSIRRVSAEEVFGCNPYILFYEKKDEYEVLPTIIKADNNLNIFINALSSCVVFINWLNKISVNNDSIIIKRLLYLTDLANGNITRNINFEEYPKEWIQKDINDTMKVILISIKEEVITEENLFQVGIQRKIFCDCGNTSMSPQEFHWFLDLYSKDSTSNIQTMVNTFLYEDQTICGNVCGLKHCNHQSGKQRNYLSGLLPPILCIKITDIKRRPSFNKQYFNITLTKYRSYDLKSVITEFGLHCYRKIGDQWYEVKENSSKNVSINDVLKCKAYLLFYECQDLITFDKPLSCILHSFSSCSTIIEWLNIVKNRRNMIKGRFIYDMINIIKGESKEDNQREKMVYMWNDLHFNDIYQLLKIMLQDLEEESNTECGNDENYNLRLPMKFRRQTKIPGSSGEDKMSYLRDKLIFNIDIHEDSQTIQQLFDVYLNDSDAYNKDTNPFQILSKCLLEPLPKLICVHLKIFYDENKIRKKKFNSIKMLETISITDTNISDDDYSKIVLKTNYKLKSVIEHYGEPCSGKYMCYKNINDRWVYVYNEKMKPITLDEVLDFTPYIAFYEIDDTEDVSPNNQSFQNIELHTHLNRTFKTISFGDIPFNLHFFNFLQSFSACPKLINNLIKIGLFKMYEDSKMRLWAKDYYDNTLKPFTKIFNEILNNPPQIVLPLIIFDFSYNVDDSPICLSLSKYNLPSFSNSLQQLWDQRFEFLCNPSIDNIRIYIKKFDGVSQEILFSGTLPDTVGFYIPSRIFKSYLNKPFKFIMRNEFCPQYSKVEGKGNSESEECLNYGKCCKKYHLKSIICKDNKCYEVVNDQFYLLTESEAPILIENFNNIHVTLMLYEQ